MKCPVCTSVNLVMSERQGIEIDYCPECRGVWLDRGELDKIIERAIPLQHEKPEHGNEPRHHQPPQPAQRVHENPSYQHGHHDQKGYGYGHNYKKKKSLLSELFDFD